MLVYKVSRTMLAKVLTPPDEIVVSIICLDIGMLFSASIIELPEGTTDKVSTELCFILTLIGVVIGVLK
jgi:hypothetical protein